MEEFFVKVNRDKIRIDKNTFLELLDLSPVKDYVSYTKAVAFNEISLEDLKLLSFKAGVPYPLFFAPRNIVEVQIRDKNHNLYAKIASKDEIRLSSRGKMELQDIELIVKDIGRKQEFLKSRLLPNEKSNNFIGCVAKKIKENKSNTEIANEIRSRLGIDLSYLRSLPKNKVLNYLCNQAEANGIFVSFSSYNYMPQNISKDVELSGICIKDKKFPFIFINTRDGEEVPRIIESSGRQIFTLTAMFVCIATNRFVLSTKFGKKEEGVHERLFAIAGELLIPKSDLSTVKPTNLDSLKDYAQKFKVTPSMLLVRLKQIKNIDNDLANYFREKLSEEVKKSEPKQKHQPLQINGYSKYNGERFSKEIIKGYRAGTISQEEVKNVLFRRGKMEQGLLQEYVKRFN